MRKRNTPKQLALLTIHGGVEHGHDVGSGNAHEGRASDRHGLADCKGNVSLKTVKTTTQLKAPL
jgi:hypothetical protein